MKLLYLGLFLLLMQNDCRTAETKTIEKKDEKLISQNQSIIKVSPTQEEKQVSDNREILAKRVEGVDAETAQAIRDPKTEITKISTPFFPEGRILQASSFAPTHPIISYIGIDDKNFTVILNANAEGFFELAEKAHVTVEKKDVRLEYCKVFLETVLAPDKRLQVLKSVNDIEKRPNLSEAEEKQFEEFKEKYQKIITAPQISDAVPSKAVFFVIKKQDLVRLDLTVLLDGKIEVQEKVLEKELLIPYSL